MEGLGETGTQGRPQYFSRDRANPKSRVFHVLFHVLTAQCDILCRARALQGDVFCHPAGGSQNLSPPRAPSLALRCVCCAVRVRFERSTRPFPKPPPNHGRRVIGVRFQFFSPAAQPLPPRFSVEGASPGPAENSRLSTPQVRQAPTAGPSRHVRCAKAMGWCTKVTTRRFAARSLICRQSQASVRAGAVVISILQCTYRMCIKS